MEIRLQTAEWPKCGIAELVQKRLASGGYDSVEHVLRSALEAQDLMEAEDWTDEERRAIRVHIEEGYQQALRGELLTEEESRRQLKQFRQRWREERAVRSGSTAH